MKESENKNSVGNVETRYFNLPKGQSFVLQSGLELPELKIAYQTYGTLAPKKDNAILIEHALSGDAHAAGYTRDSRKAGWWDQMIGPGKAFDTDKYFVICSNVIGGCKGSTGPNSISPDTGKHYGLSFPLVSLGDMVNAQRKLIDHLGVKRLVTVAGGSMGAMQALQWSVLYPDMVLSCIPIAGTYKHFAQQIAFDEVGRQAIMSDPDWNGGDYYEKSHPSVGLSLARMIGHITYMSHHSMEKKFGRAVKNEKLGFEFSSEFEVEGYLRYRGDSFVKRFDANSYLYLTKAMDYFDLQGEGSLQAAFKDVKSRFMVIAFSSDWLYPPKQSKQMVKALKMNGVDVTYCEISSDCGHDAFLLEFEEETRLIRHFIDSTHKKLGKKK